MKRTNLFLFLAQSRIFWQLRDFFKKVQFFILAKYFYLRWGIREEIYDTNTLGELVKLALPQLVFATAVVLTIQWADGYFVIAIKRIIQLADKRLNILPSVSRLNVPDDSDYVTLLATVATVGGVFIGLYYAGVTATAGAVYSRVPNNVRNLLVRERVGNVYMRYLAFVTFLSLCLIGLCLFGFPRSHSAIPIVCLLSGIGIISFVKLGQHAFYLFDPTRLADSIFDYLRLWVRLASVEGFRWADPSFQYHTHKQAKSEINTLETLSAICAGEQYLNGRPYVDLARYAMLFLANYQKYKSCIPSESRWYEQRYVYRNWYQVGDTEIDIAIKTGTSIRPEVVVNKNWVEEATLPIVIQCLEVNLYAKRFDLVSELLTYLDVYLKVLAHGGEVKEAFNLANNLAEKLASGISKLEAKHISGNESLEHIGLAEHLAMLPITILLSYLKAIDNLSREQISKQLSVIRWDSPTSLYKSEFHAYTLPQLEWLMPRLQFEQSVEDKMISPLWYQTELVVLVETGRFSENINALFQSCAQYDQRFYGLFENSKHPWLSAASLSRQWEYWNKMEVHLPKLAEIWKLLNDKRYLDDLPWSQLDTNGLSQQIKERQNEILKEMAKQNIILAFLPRPNDFPDYGGQFINTIGDSILDTLISNDVKTTEAIFPSYFYGCLKKFEDLIPKVGSVDWRTQQEILIASAPLLDLLELSGYARLYSDFHNEPNLWVLIQKVWDAYFDQKKSVSASAQVLKIISTAVCSTDAWFGISPRGVLRTGWKMRVEHQLRKLPRKESRHHSSSIYASTHTVVSHPSPLVQLFACEHYSCPYDGMDIFISLYLSKRPEANSLEFGRKWRTELEESLKRTETDEEAEEV